MKHEILMVDAADPIRSGVTVYYDTGDRLESFEGEGAERVRVLTPIVGSVTFGPPEPSIGPDKEAVLPSADDYIAMCRAQADGILNPKAVVMYGDEKQLVEIIHDDDIAAVVAGVHAEREPAPAEDQAPADEQLEA